MSARRVLVTGATGRIGSEVAAELRRRGHRVRALVRPGSDAGPLGAAGIEVARGDVLDRASVEAALEGCDAVVHSAGLPSLLAPRRALLELNAGAVEVVLGAALAAGVARAVLTSSSAVLGGSRRPRVADEETTSSADTIGLDYFVSKKRGEEVGLDLASRGLPLVVVRPAVVIGPGARRGSSADLVLALARRRVPAYVQGGASFCDVRDVARGHAAALERGRPGETYLLGGHNLTLDEFVNRVCRLAGVAAPPRLPVALALGATRLLALLARVGGPASPLDERVIRASRLYGFVTSARAQRELGYAIRPFEESVRDALRWDVAQGRLDPSTPELRALAAESPPPAAAAT